mgnify:CR=1 FL=1
MSINNNFNDIKRGIEEIVRKITDKYKIEKIILFGSYAYGNPDKDSDIDICVITDEDRRKIDLINEIRMELFDLEYSLDILIYKSEDFRYRSDSKTSIERVISENGVVLYG